MGVILRQIVSSSIILYLSSFQTRVRFIILFVQIHPKYAPLCKKQIDFGNLIMVLRFKLANDCKAGEIKVCE